MAQISNVYDTTGAKGNREDLADFIAMISPEETPLYSLCKDEKASANKHI